MYHVRQAR